MRVLLILESIIQGSDLVTYEGLQPAGGHFTVSVEKDHDLSLSSFGAQEPGLDQADPDRRPNQSTGNNRTDARNEREKTIY